MTTQKSGANSNESGSNIDESGSKSDTSKINNKIDNNNDEFFKNVSKEYKNGERKFKPFYQENPMRWKAEAQNGMWLYMASGLNMPTKNQNWVAIKNMKNQTKN